MSRNSLQILGVSLAIGAAFVLGGCGGSSGGGGGNGKPAGIQIDSIDAIVSVVSLGEQAVPVTMTVRNPGLGNLVITQAALTLTQGAVDVTGEYLIVARPGNPSAVAPGGSEVLTFDVSVRPTATAGITQLSGSAVGKTNGKGKNLFSGPPLTLDSWEVRSVVIRSMTPPEGAQAGGVFKIHGALYSSVRSENTVLMDGTPLTIVYHDRNQIRAMVPGGTPAGSVNIVVDVNGEQSLPYPFTINPPGGVNWVVESEPNDSFGTANSFSLDLGQVDVQGALIDPIGDVDYYHFTYNPASFGPNSSVEIDITADVLGSLLDSVVTIYDGSQNVIGFSDDDGFSYNSLASLSLPAGGEFYVLVEDYFLDGGINFFYDLSVTVSPANSLFVSNYANGTLLSYGVSMGDLTGDGMPEIFGAEVAVNDGTGNFTQGITLDTWAHAVNFGDVDNDGDNDVWVAMHDIGPPFANIFYRNNGYPALVDETNAVGLPLGNEIYLGVFVDYDNDGWLDLCTFGDWTCEMWRNDGTGSAFTKQSGIGLDPIVMSGHCSSGAFADYDNDGDQDLYIVRELGADDLLMENQGGMFVDVTAIAGTAGPGAPAAFDDGYSVEWADVDNDGWLDIYVSNYTNSLPNWMYTNNGDGTFTQVTGAVVNTPTWDNDASFADFNNDGWIDVLVSNVFHVNQQGTFDPDSAVDFGLGGASPWMAAIGDADANGGVDIFDSFKLYSNQGSGLNWLELELVGGAPTPGKSNRSAIGARVHVQAGALSMIREVNGGSGYVGQHDLIVHFGLGLEVIVDQITINWPSGLVQTLNNVSPNQRMVVTEP